MKPPPKPFAFLHRIPPSTTVLLSHILPIRQSFQPPSHSLIVNLSSRKLSNNPRGSPSLFPYASPAFSLNSKLTHQRPPPSNPLINHISASNHDMEEPEPRAMRHHAGHGLIWTHRTQRPGPHSQVNTRDTPGHALRPPHSRKTPC